MIIVTNILVASLLVRATHIRRLQRTVAGGPVVFSVGWRSRQFRRERNLSFYPKILGPFVFRPGLQSLLAPAGRTLDSTDLLLLDTSQSGLTFIDTRVKLVWLVGRLSDVVKVSVRKLSYFRR